MTGAAPAATPEPAIHVRGLTRVFGSFRAVDELHLAVPAGEIYGFLGPNGSGKTTTLKMLTGLLAPSAGEAYIAGERVRPGEASVELRRKVGFLAEEPAFYPWMTPQEFLSFVGGLFGLSRSRASDRARELLATVGLLDRADDRIRGFSRGMRQRLGIAQALVGDPEVLLLDEPASALDPIGRREVLELIAALKDHATIVMSSHVLDDVQRVATWIGVISQGALVVESPLRDLLRRSAQPVFQIEVAEGRERMRSALEAEPWAQEVLEEGTLLRVLTSDLEAAERRIPALITREELRLVDLSLLVPTLEDVFLRLVGPTGASAADEVQAPAGEEPA